MYKITFYCGGTDRAGKYVPFSTYASVLNQEVRGYTAINTMGAWEGVEEPSYMVIVFALSDNSKGSHSLLARRLAQEGNQVCVLMEVEPMPEGRYLCIHSDQAIGGE